MVDLAGRWDDDGVKPWERLQREPDNAWDAFVVFREMSRDTRQLNKLCESTGNPQRTVTRWVSKWRWRERILAWDRHVDDLAREKLEQAASAMGERLANTAVLHLQALLAPVRELTRRLQSDPSELEGIPMEQLLEIIVRSGPTLQAAAKVEAFGRGVPWDKGGPVFNVSATATSVGAIGTEQAGFSLQDASRLSALLAVVVGMIDDPEINLPLETRQHMRRLMAVRLRHLLGSNPEMLEAGSVDELKHRELKPPEG